jgi:hypothetical protein
MGMPAIDSIAGKYHPLSLDTCNVLIKNFLKQDSGGSSPAIESIAGIPQRYQIFDAGGHMIRSEHMKSCLAAEKRFLLFKGPGPFKKFLKSAEMSRIYRPID